MGYDKNYLVKVFAKRTRENLDFIETEKPEFEITQLLNSCLGLLVFPRKVCLKNFPNTPLRAEEWSVSFVDKGFQQPESIQQLVKHLRNGIAHCYLKLFPDDKNEIESLCVWDECPNCHEKKWQVTWSIPDFRKFVRKFSDILIRGDYCPQCPGCSKQFQSESE
jgi:hypothetical protein